jgi:hypothetical protein
MNRFFSLVVAIVMTATAAAQNQTITVDKLDLFKELQVNGKIELFVTINPTAVQSMSIDMNGGDPNQLKWWANKGALQIKYSSKSKSEPIIIHLNCCGFESIDAQGASVTVEGEWSGDMLTAQLTTSAKFTAEAHCKDLKVSMQTGATAILTGEACWADYDVRTKSTLDARALAAVSTSLRANSFSETYIYGTERVVIDAADGASVFYRGTPEIFRERTSRGGHTNPIGE